jgi:hypothetical protein
MSRHICFSSAFFVLSAIRRHSAALARYSLALLMTRALSAARKERQRQHRIEHLVSDNHHQSRVVMFAALSEVSNDANGVIECGSIIRQRCAEPIIVLVVGPSDREEILRHRALSLTTPSCGTAKMWLQEPFRRGNFSEISTGAAGWRLADHAFNLSHFVPDQIKKLNFPIYMSLTRCYPLPRS